LSQENSKTSEVRCPSCGRKVEALIRGRCPTCFLEQEGLVSLPKLHVTLCRDCLSYKSSGSWRPGGGEASETIRMAVEEQLSGRVKVAEPLRLLSLRVGRPVITKNRANAEVYIRIGGLQGSSEEREVALQSKVALEKVLCRVCQLKRSDYFSCIVQLRAEGRPLEAEEVEWATEMVHRRARLASPNSMDYLSRIADRKEGRDFYLGSASLGRFLARQMVSERGGVIRESKRMIGVERGSGRQLYKFTLLVRLPHLRPGDVTLHRDIFYTILHHSGSRATMMDAEGKSVTLEREKADLPLVARREEVEDALVLEVRPDGIQILDPRSNTTFDMSERPPGVRVGGTIRVFWFEGIPRYVPEISDEG